MRLDGRVALVTGATGNVGQGIAQELVRVGARVAVSGLNQRELDAFVAKLRPLGDEALGVAADVRRKSDVEALLSKTLSQWGQVDILVNNATTVASAKLIEEFDDAEFDDIVQTNLKGTFLCSQVVGHHMVSRASGVIINVSCVSGRYKPGSNSALYAATQNGVCGLTRQLAKLLGPHGVRVNAVLAGDTAVEGQASPSSLVEEEATRRKSEIFLNRFGTPRDLGLAVVMLASDYAAWVTGESLSVSGGQVTG